MKRNNLKLARAGMIAALYAVTTLLLAPMSFGMIQFRVSEALTLLPVLWNEAVPGLAVGCLIGNLLSGAVWYDVVFGSLATLIAAMLTRKLRKRLWIAAAMPAVVNGAIIGTVVCFAYMTSRDWKVLLGCCGAVAAGEIAVCFILGVPLIRLMEKREATKEIR